MLAGFAVWKKFEPLLSEEEYKCLEEKLRHVKGYIADYLDPAKLRLEDLFNNLELDATVSYYSAENSAERMTPWLLHSSYTFEIEAAEISGPVTILMRSLMDLSQTPSAIIDISGIARLLVSCLEMISRNVCRSDCLLLLYGIDICLVKIIDRICTARVLDLLEPKRCA